MNIAFLTPEYPHPKTGSSGGIGTSIKNLADELIKQNHKVLILVYGQDADTIFFDDSIEIHSIKNIKFKGFSWYLTRKKIQKKIDLLYENKQIDIVEAPDWTGITSFIKPKKCPIIIKLHGSDTYFCYLDKRPVKFLNRFHEKRALKNADGHISVSQYTADITNKIFNTDIDFTIIPNGIDINLFSPKENNIVEKNILYFGTLIRKKGLLELPYIFNEVVKENPLAKLILIGRDSPDIMSGNESTWQMMISLFSKEALKNVHYIGIVPYTEIQHYISCAKVCVFPSFAEAFPVSWLEAMAMRKAIVASEIGWGKEVIEENISGLLENPKNHISYANKINYLLENSSFAEQLGNNALERIKNHFNNTIIAQENIKYYTKIIKSNP